MQQLDVKLITKKNGNWITSIFSILNSISVAQTGAGNVSRKGETIHQSSIIKFRDGNWMGIGECSWTWV